MCKAGSKETEPFVTANLQQNVTGFDARFICGPLAINTCNKQSHDFIQA